MGNEKEKLRLLVIAPIGIFIIATLINVILKGNINNNDLIYFALIPSIAILIGNSILFVFKKQDGLKKYLVAPLLSGIISVPLVILIGNTSTPSNMFLMTIAYTLIATFVSTLVVKGK